MSRLTFFFFECYGAHRDLHSFPTRRSSDLLDRRERDAEGARLDLVPSRADAELAAPAAQVIDGDRGLREQRSEEHTSELQSLTNLVCRLLLEKNKTTTSRPDNQMRRSPQLT